MSYRYLIPLLFSMLCTSVFAQPTGRERVELAASQLVGDDSLAVAVVEIDGQWIAGVQKEVADRLGPDLNPVVNSPAFAVTRGFVESFRSAGAKELVVVVGTSDLNPNIGPIGAITTNSPDEAKAVAGLTSSLLAMAGPDGKRFKVVPQEAVVLVGLEAAVEKYENQAVADSQLASQIAELVAQGESQEPPIVAAVVNPGNDPRRVVRELWPHLPKPFEKLTGELLADQTMNVSVLVSCPPEWKVNLKVETKSDTAAEVLSQAIDDGWKLLIEQIAKQSAPPEVVSLLTQAATMFAPQIEGTSVVIEVDSTNDAVAQLVTDVLMPALEASRESARRMQQMNQFKQLALGMLNFESANKFIPAAAAIVDYERKPLLSWRVAILPFLEKSDLYDQFHLDEPWDSPHNLKLVVSMPEVYADASHPELTAEGYTTYLVPTHPGSIFPSIDATTELKPYANNGRKWIWAKGTPFREVKDGSSQTLLIVQAPAELAVPWTKPADWEVDLAKALEQLRGSEHRSAAVAAYSDGSCRIWQLDDPAMEENLPKLITRDGGEIIQH